MKYNENALEPEENKIIITEDGLFYSNYDKQTFTTIGDPDGIYDPDRVLLFSLTPEKFPTSILQLREAYGIKIGKPQSWANGKISDNQVGLYIVDYKGYLNDVREKILTNKGKSKI